MAPFASISVQARATLLPGQPQRTYHHTPSHSRRRLVLAPLLLAWLGRDRTARAELATKNNVDPALNAAFNRALESQNLEDAEAAWSDALQLAPKNSACWSNRGTIRLQMGKWSGAKEDLEKALALSEESESYVNAIILVNLGNAEGALGNWDSAMQKYLDAGNDEDVGELALGNYALALFQVGQDEKAIGEARSLLRKDPNFLDMRCALTAFLWGSKDESAAEVEYQALLNAEDGLGAELYGKSGVIDRVKGRWPPRATAALDAYLQLQRSGSALNYDGDKQTFEF